MPCLSMAPGLRVRNVLQTDPETVSRDGRSKCFTPIKNILTSHKPSHPADNKSAPPHSQTDHPHKSLWYHPDANRWLSRRVAPPLLIPLRPLAAPRAAGAESESPA